MTPHPEFKPYQVATLSLLILVCIVVPYGKSVVALALLPLALMDRNKALFSLMALFLVRMSSSAIVGFDPLLAPAAWMTSLAASTRLWLDFAVQGRRIATHQSKSLSVYMLVTLALSSFSLSPEVSFLKAFAFFYIAGAILLGVATQAPTKTTTVAWLCAGWASVLITSVPTLAFPDVGYFRDGQGFQGSLNHPQALGIFVAPLLSWLLAKSFIEKKITIRLAVTLIFVIFILLLTRARTGVVSILLGAAILGIFRVGAIGSWMRWLTRRKASLLVLPLILLIVPILFTGFRGGIQEYVFKSASSENLVTAFEESRGFIILQAINNIENHPITGIGFGVSSSETHEFNIEVDTTTGLPVGAPTEKANLVIAVLEESGIVGSVAFFIFFLSFLRAIANSTNIALAWAALTAVGTNISEVTFFAMGGLGTYIWIICALAVVLAPSQFRHVRGRWTRSNLSTDGHL
jgi:hypothetical protein